MTIFSTSADANIIAQSMQSEAKKIGIKIKLNQVENVNDIKAAGTFDLCSANNSSAPTGDPRNLYTTTLFINGFRVIQDVIKTQILII